MSQNVEKLMHNANFNDELQLWCEAKVVWVNEGIGSLFKIEILKFLYFFTFFTIFTIFLPESKKLASISLLTKH